MHARVIARSWRKECAGVRARQREHGGLGYAAFILSLSSSTHLFFQPLCACNCSFSLDRGCMTSLAVTLPRAAPFSALPPWDVLCLGGNACFRRRGRLTAVGGCEFAPGESHTHTHIHTYIYARMHMHRLGMFMF